MTTVNISPLILPAIQPQSYGRNGQLVPATAMAALARGANQVARWRTKEVFAHHGQVSNIAASAGAGPTTLAHGHISTGPYCKRLRWHILHARPTGSGGDPFIRLTITDVALAAIGTADSHVPYAGTAADVPNEWVEQTGTIDVSPSTAMLLTFTANNNARMISATVHEESFAPDTANGYFVDSYNNTGPIYDTNRSLIASGMSTMWTAGGAHILCWTGSRSSASATDTNIVDGTSTVIAASAPSYLLDMQGKYRLKDSAVGVVCKLAVFGSALAGPNGSVKLKDQGGTTLATVSGFGVTPAWQTTTVTLPGLQRPYYLTLSTAASTVTITDVSLREGP